ncbi:MAG TPA: hypothetical protein VFR58_09775 [Flavisolibacter sp.]|nr:hypothetical protein [Flavisolibacter sp.]
MKKTFFAFLCCIAVAGAFGQSKKLVTHSLLGLSFPDNKNLDKELKQGGRLETASAYFSRGAGFYVIFPKVRLATMNYFNTYSGTRESGDRSSAVRGTQVGSSIGILLRRDAAFQVIPYAGLAYTFFGVRAAGSSPADGSSFTSYASGTPNQIHLSSNQWMGNAGFQFAKEGLGKSGLTKNIVIGLRAGYFLPLGQSKWKTNDTNLSGGPDVNTGGFYTSLLLGLIQ